MSEKLVTQKEDFNQWYQDVVVRTGLADYAPVKGCMVIKPYGYAIWERIQEVLGGKIKETGHQNMYFPMLIPESFLQKETEHVEGFSPELAVVTHAGGKKLEENLVVRPTSETIIYSMFAKWIHSYRDLPLLINQWANVIRWELRTRLFLRTTEFLWQEGHTAHATHEESLEEVLKMLEVYRQFAREYLAVPVVSGLKSDAEKFAGALSTYAIEALMRDKKSLQMGTSHDLGQNFAKVFKVKFLDQGGTEQLVWQTSWGVSTRLLGAVVMTHGDDKGLILPPRVAPLPLVVVPIWKTDQEKALVLETARKLTAGLKGLNFKIDDRDTVTPGFKFNEWEQKGVPLRLELGPRDVEKESAVLVRRDTGEKQPVAWAELEKAIPEKLEAIQQGLLERAEKFQQEHTFNVDTWAEFNRTLAEPGGFLNAHWCGGRECEAHIKETTKATVRVMPFEKEPEIGKCVLCGKDSPRRVLFAKAY